MLTTSLNKDINKGAEDFIALARKNQSPHVTSIPNKFDPVKAREAFSQKVQDSLKLICNTMKNILPDKPPKTGEMLQAMVGFNQAEVAQLQSEQLTDLFQRMKFSNPQQYLDLEVAVDDSTRIMGEGDVTFDYEINHAKGDLPRNVSIDTKIRILNSKGVLVYTGKGVNLEGKHKFVWNGKDNKGKKLPAGEYRIQGESYARYHNNSKASIKLDFKTSFNGIAESISYENDNPKIIVNGQKVDQKDIIFATRPLKKSKELKAEDYINYIGKTVSYDLSKVQIKDGKALVHYNNKVENPGSVKLDIYDANEKYITSIDYKTKLEQGSGTLELTQDEHGLADGVYICKMSVEDLSNNKIVKLPSNFDIKITGLDVPGKKLIAGKDKYDLANITAVSNPHELERSLYDKGNNYIGKQVYYLGGEFNTVNGSMTIDASIPKPKEGKKLGDLELVIFKGDEKVATVTKPANEIYHQDMISVPRYVDLDANSKAKVNDFIQKNLRLPEVPNFDNLNRQEKLAINAHIEQRFRAGELFITGQDPQDKTTRLKNMGKTIIEWDGTLQDNNYADDSEVYRYELYTSTLNNDGTDFKKEKISNNTSGYVLATEVKDEQLKLVLDNGKILGLEDIISISS